MTWPEFDAGRAHEAGNPLTRYRDGSLLHLVLDRPDVHNALNGALLEELGSALRGAAADLTVRVVTLTGAGQKAFCAGADLDELAGLDAEEAKHTLGHGREVLRQLEQLPVPVITAVNGLALGGGFELALASSFTIAAETASFGLPETGLGLMPGYGGTQRLPRLIGKQAALHLALTGERMDATRAHALGLVAVPPVPAEDLPALAETTAQRIAARGPKANRYVLEAVHAGSDSSLDAGLRLESTLAAVAASSAEAAEGIRAFREHHTPSFGDRR